jgi:hypothetical protein
MAGSIDAREPVPGPIHRAIDALTVALLDVQGLRRSVAHGHPIAPDELLAHLDSIELQLHDLGTHPTALRPEPQPPR